MSVSPCTHCLCGLIQPKFFRSDRSSFAYTMGPLSKENKHPNIQKDAAWKTSYLLPLVPPHRAAKRLVSLHHGCGHMREFAVFVASLPRHQLSPCVGLFTWCWWTSAQSAGVHRAGAPSMAARSTFSLKTHAGFYGRWRGGDWGTFCSLWAGLSLEQQDVLIFISE